MSSWGYRGRNSPSESSFHRGSNNGGDDSYDEDWEQTDNGDGGNDSDPESDHGNRRAGNYEDDDCESNATDPDDEHGSDDDNRGAGDRGRGRAGDAPHHVEDGLPFKFTFRRLPRAAQPLSCMRCDGYIYGGHVYARRYRDRWAHKDCWEWALEGSTMNCFHRGWISSRYRGGICDICDRSLHSGDNRIVCTRSEQLPGDICAHCMGSFMEAS
ncbi:hypothetical protein PLESTB_001605400 [Pleodorina starrii]|uniref:Uncharacterized protein n=1 Tax=Pleodorina starrii TaxID=330485 RepID=A0A9W6F8M3_9CHLO|nr:hypothetical protein PLESTB_001605400 [Pleodorina starrii]